MQKLFKLKQLFLLLGLMLPTVWNAAYGTYSTDGLSVILIKEGFVQGTPKGSTIQASIDGHTLSVVFTEALGQVLVEVTTASGIHVDCLMMTTPNGYIYHVTDTGDYIVTFTLPNGDVYYGEFTVTD